MACRFQSPTIVGWMPCFVANCAVVSLPHNASSATFALKSAEYRFRLLVIQVRPSQEQTELKPLSEIRVPPHHGSGHRHWVSGGEIPEAPQGRDALTGR